MGTKKVSPGGVMAVEYAREEQISQTLASAAPHGRRRARGAEPQPSKR